MPKRSRAYWICQVIGWGAVGCVTLFFAYSYKIPISSEFLYQIIVVSSTGIFITHLLRLVIRKNDWLLLPVERVIPKMIMAVIITSLLHSLLRISLVEVFKISIEKRNLAFETKVLLGTFDSGLLILSWLLIYYFYHFIEKSRRQQVNTLQLESLIKELELKTIKAHINPHFIFNSLNSIRALVVENPQRARAAVTELSNILRSSMQSDKSETVSLEKELDIVKDYLALENMRFEDRLKIEYEIDEDTLDQPVPPMMLQTLVENAIKHGISKQIKGGVVKIISDFKGNYHEMAVQNTGQLNGYLNGQDPGFGLSSTTDRLNLLYGDNAKFEIKQITPSLVEAKVMLPVEKI